MRVTLRISNGEYLDIELDTRSRTMRINNPIPNLSEEKILEISELYKYKIELPITGDIVVPSVDNITPEEVDKYYSVSTEDALNCFLTVANMIILEN